MIKIVGRKRKVSILQKKKKNSTTIDLRDFSSKAAAKKKRSQGVNE